MGSRDGGARGLAGEEDGDPADLGAEVLEDENALGGQVVVLEGLAVREGCGESWVTPKQWQ